MKRLNVLLDDAVLDAARAASGERSYAATVRRGLLALVGARPARRSRKSRPCMRRRGRGDVA